MLAHERGVNEWVGKIKLTSFILSVGIFEANRIVTKTMHLFDCGNHIAIIINQLKPIGIRLTSTCSLTDALIA